MASNAKKMPKFTMDCSNQRKIKAVKRRGGDEKDKEGTE
jgi:hypothetical protein